MVLCARMFGRFGEAADFDTKWSKEWRKLGDVKATLINMHILHTHAWYRPRGFLKVHPDTHIQPFP